MDEKQKRGYTQIRKEIMRKLDIRDFKDRRNTVKEHKIQKKIGDILQSEIASAVFFIILGLCFLAVPVQTVDVICRIIFGVLLIFAGLFNIAMYLVDGVRTTVFNMFAGVIVLVLGWFMFENPQIVVKLLPRLLGALVIVDSAWQIRAAFRLKKREISIWNAFLIVGIICVILGIIMIINPFQTVRRTILFSGIIFLLNGVLDIVFYLILRKHKVPVPSEPVQGVTPDVPPVPGTELMPGTGHHGFFNNEPEMHTSFGEPPVEDDPFSMEQNSPEFGKNDEVLEEWKD